MSDSIAKNVDYIQGVTLQAFPGDTIARLAHRIDYGVAKLDNFDYVIIHVGTNDVELNFKRMRSEKEAYDAILSDFGNLIGIIRKKKPKINIIISSILPRPKDYDQTDIFTRKINSYLLNNMSKPYKFTFIKSYRPFVYCGKVRRELFAKKDGGLHLNTQGSERLRYYFMRSIASM